MRKVNSFFSFILRSLIMRFGEITPRQSIAIHPSVTPNSHWINISSSLRRNNRGFTSQVKKSRL